MKNFMHLLARCLFISALLYVPLSHAADNSPRTGNETESQLIRTLLTALQANDYSQFVGAGTDNFAKLDKGQFNTVAAQIGPRLKAGYDATRLGDYRQQNYVFSIWKIAFKDGGDDLIGTLNVLNGQVGGFVLR